MLSCGSRRFRAFPNVFRSFCSQAHKKTFCPSGTVVDRESYYYLPRPQLAKQIAENLDAQVWPIIYGPRASGKSSLQLDIMYESRKDKHIVLPFDWYDLRVDSVAHYWTDFSEALVAALLYHYLDPASGNDAIPRDKQATLRDACNNFLRCDLTTKNSLTQLFSSQQSPFALLRNQLNLRTIISGDGFSRLYDLYKDENAKPAERQKAHVITIVEETLDTLRSLKNHRNFLHSMMAFGTFAVYDSVSGKASPFEVKDRVAIPSLTLEEVRTLFATVERDYNTKFAQGIVEDVYQLTAGHVGLVGVFGNVLIHNELNEQFVGLREDKQIWNAFMSSPLMLEHITAFPGILDLIKAMIEQAPSADTFHNVTS